MSGNKKYETADEMQVYLWYKGTYYPTTLSQVNGEEYTLIGWYDGGLPRGRRQDPRADRGQEKLNPARPSPMGGLLLSAQRIRSSRKMNKIYARDDIREGFLLSARRIRSG